MQAKELFLNDVENVASAMSARSLSNRSQITHAVRKSSILLISNSIRKRFSTGVCYQNIYNSMKLPIQKSVYPFFKFINYL